MIRAFIFDQDGTLYPKNSPLTTKIRERTKELISESLSVSRSEVERIYAQLPIEFPHPYHGLLSLGLSPEEYHKEVFEKIDPSKFLNRDNSLINLFEKITQPKFRVTLASPNYSKAVQDALGIQELVSQTISMIRFSPSYSKAIAYNHIKDTLGVSNQEICVVGDNFSVDIFPAIESGFKAILVSHSTNPGQNCRSISDIYKLEELL